MDDLTTIQADLRRQLRVKRRAIPQITRQIAAQRASNHARQWIDQHLSAVQGKRIGVYLALPEELDTAGLIKQLWQSDAQLYLPYVCAHKTPLHWQPYHSDTELVSDGLGMAAPQDRLETRLVGMALDLVIVPLVGWDRYGQRIGMGGGFYDRTFAAKITGQAPLLLGYAFACQEITQGIIPHPWDVRLDGIANEVAAFTITGAAHA